MLSYKLPLQIASIICLIFGFSAYAFNANCPSGYIKVPADAHLGTKSFCVMQYEAKAWKDLNQNGIIDAGEIKPNGCHGTEVHCDSNFSDTEGNWGESQLTHLPVSVPEGRPWRYLNRGEIRRDGTAINGVTKACQRLGEWQAPPAGTAYDLIINKEWQAIGHDIETAKDESGNLINWVNGQIKQGRVNSDSLLDGGDLSRSHTLSTGDVIYDFSGNVWEWVKDSYRRGFGREGYMADMAWTGLGPIGQYTCNEANNHCGMGYGYFPAELGETVYRGGSWDDQIFAGIYSTRFSYDPHVMSDHTGFRCVLHDVN